MSKKISLYRMRLAKDDFLFRIVTIAHDCGVSPNIMTALGMCLGIAAGVFLAFCQTPFALVLGFLSVFCDVIDGAIARKFQAETAFGRIFDSISDRVCELAIVIGALTGRIIEPLGVMAIIGTITLFELRVLSHTRGLNTDYVMFGRTERLVFILLGLILPYTSLRTLCFVVAGMFGFASSIQIVVVLSRQHIHGREAVVAKKESPN